MQTAVCGVVGTTPNSRFVTIDTRCYGRAVASGAKARMRTEVAADLSSQEPPALLRPGDRASGVAFGLIRARLIESRRSPWAAECNPGRANPSGSYFAGRNATFRLKATPAAGWNE